MSKIAVYRRVSTVEQDTTSQWHIVEAWLTQRGIGPDDYVIYEDHGISGKRSDRAAYQRLLNDVATKRINTVVTYSLSRVSRDAVTAMQLLMTWMAQDVEFFSVTEPLLQLGHTNPLRLVICSLFATFADLERQAIVARTRAGLAAARARGVRLGAAPKLTPTQLVHAKAARAGGASVLSLAQRYNVSQATMSRSLRRGGSHAMRSDAPYEP